MKYDETELIGFFGVMPEEVAHEEKEFFGSCAFVVRRGNLTLRVSFSSTYSPKMIAELLPSIGGTPIVCRSARGGSYSRRARVPKTGGSGCAGRGTGRRTAIGGKGHDFSGPIVGRCIGLSERCDK
jgi:hypothetical protein